MDPPSTVHCIDNDSDTCDDVFSGPTEEHCMHAPFRQEVWNPAGDHGQPQLMKDYAAQPGNAFNHHLAKKITPKAENTEENPLFIPGLLQILMCYWHAVQKWFQRRGNGILTNKENSEKIMADFKSFRDLCPNPESVNFWRHCLMWKISIAHKEPKLAEKWFSVFGNCSITRTECNIGNPIRGGMYTDNNSVEGQNGKDKSFFNSRRSGASNFVSRLQLKIAEESALDLNFIGTVKTNVHSRNFYKIEVHKGFLQDYFLSPRENSNKKASPFDCMYKIQNKVRNGIPIGSFLIPTNVFFGTIIEEHRGKGIEFDLKNYKMVKQLWCNKTGLGSKGCLKYIDMFCDPTTLEDGKIRPNTFDGLLYVARCFRLMRPINGLPENAVNVRNAIRSLRTALSDTGVDMLMTFEDVILLGEKGFMSCSCHTYMLRGWCKHAFSIALIRGIISYPKGMDPRPTNPARRRAAVVSPVTPIKGPPARVKKNGPYSIV
jgi:hypothetical protein